MATRPEFLAPAGAAEEAGVKNYLRELFEHGVSAVRPARVLPPHLPHIESAESLTIAAIGKAAGAMALACQEHYGHPLRGLVLTRHGHVPTGLQAGEGLDVLEGGHPLPDKAGLAGAHALKRLAEGLDEQDHLLLLLSGGASSLLLLPVPGLSHDEARDICRSLLMSGARIEQVNCVRRHIGQLGGGRLAALAWPARISARLISDVVGDDPGIIGSGPVTPDRTRWQDARDILEHHGILIPPALMAFWQKGNAPPPTPDHPVFQRSDVRIIAKADDMLEAVSSKLEADGFRVITLGAQVEGEAREVARAHAERVQAELSGRQPCAIVSGGELTVTVAEGAGRGGPNTEYVLALALALEGSQGVAAIACDSDGIDGSEDNAGAFALPSTLSRARAAGIDPRACLGRHDSYTVFEAAGALVITGPTLTNVNDLRVILVVPEGAHAYPTDKAEP